MFIPSKNGLPLLIHGKEGCGASIFSIKLVAEFIKQGNPLVFWSAYSAAKETLNKEFNGTLPSEITVIADENPQNLEAVLAKVHSNQTLFVKNFEVASKEIREKLLTKNLLIIAGDLENVLTKEEFLSFPTRILFSSFEGVDLPVLEKYQGYLFSKDKNETVKI